MFVCKGNIYRSVIAEELFRQLLEKENLGGITVISRGLHGFGNNPPTKFPNLKFYKDEWKIAKPILERIGVSVDDHVSTPISAEDMLNSDFIFAMDLNVHKSLLEAFPEYADKLNLFGQGIPDPEGVDEAEKDRIITTLIQKEIPAILAKVLSG